MPQVRSGYPTSIIQSKEPNKRKKAEKGGLFSWEEEHSDPADSPILPEVKG